MWQIHTHMHTHRHTHTLSSLPCFPLVGKQFTSSTLITIPIARRHWRLVCQRYFNYQLETWLPVHEVVQYLSFFFLWNSYHTCTPARTYTHINTDQSARLAGAEALINNVLFSSIWIIKGRVLRRSNTYLLRIALSMGV